MYIVLFLYIPDFYNFLIKDVLFCSVKYYKLYLAGISQKFQIPLTPPPLPEIHRLDPIDLKIYTLAKNP